VVQKLKIHFLRKCLILIILARFCGETVHRMLDFGLHEPRHLRNTSLELVLREEERWKQKAQHAVTMETDIGHGTSVWLIVSGIVALHFAALVYWLVA